MLRKDVSALSHGVAGADAIICEYEHELVRVAMEETETPGIWSAQLVPPPGDSELYLRFEDGVAHHGECGGTWWAPSNLLPLEGSSFALLSATKDEDRLTLTFEYPTDDESLQLLYGPTSQGPWAASQARPVMSPVDDRVVSWALDDARPPCYLKVTANTGSAAVEVLTEFLGRTRPRDALVSAGIYPNPSRHEVAWALRMDRSAAVTFEVFDIQGRRVHGPDLIPLEAGEREIRWSPDGAHFARGVYFLSATTNGRRTVARVVLTD